jgi:hypothetical protein
MRKGVFVDCLSKSTVIQHYPGLSNIIQLYPKSSKSSENPKNHLKLQIFRNNCPKSTNYYIIQNVWFTKKMKTHFSSPDNGFASKQRTSCFVRNPLMDVYKFGGLCVIVTENLEWNLHKQIEKMKRNQLTIPTHWLNHAERTTSVSLLFAGIRWGLLARCLFSIQRVINFLHSFAGKSDCKIFALARKS